MERVRYGVIGFIMIIAAMFATAPLAIGAQSNAGAGCDERLIDTTDRRVLNTADVMRAIGKLEEKGVTVRVRAFQVAPSGSLLAYQASQVLECESWRGSSGELAPMMLGLFFSMDHQSAIVYGSDIAHYLANDADAIRNSILGDQLRAGSFTAGTVAALDAITDRVSIFDWAYLGKMVGLVLGIVSAAIGLIWIITRIVSLYTRRLDAKARRERTQKEAIDLQDTAGRKLADLSVVHEDFANSLPPMIQVANDSMRRDLEAHQERLVRQFKALRATYDAAKADTETNDPTVKRSQAGYDANVTLWASLREDILEAAYDADQLQEKCRKVRDRIAGIEQLRCASIAEVEELSTIQRAHVENGFMAIDEAFAEEAVTELDAARVAVDERRYDDAEELLRDIRQRCTALANEINHVVGLSKEVPRRFNALPADSSFYSDDIAGATAALLRVSNSYSPVNWRNLQKMLVTAEAKVGLWAARYEDVRESLGHSPTDWSDVDARVAELEVLRHEIIVCCDNVVLLAEQLDNMAASSKFQCDTLKRRITDGRLSAATYMGEQLSTFEVLERLETELSAVRDTLTDSAVDYLTVRARLTKIGNQVTEALRTAEYQHNEAKAATRHRAAASPTGSRSASSASRSHGSSSGVVAADVSFNTPTSGDVGGGSFGSW